MDESSRHQIRESLREDLSRSRADLVKILKDIVRRRIAARSALWVAKMAKINPEAAYGVGDGGAPMSAEQLLELIRQIETEESRIGKLLAKVDMRLAKISPQNYGRLH